VLVQWRLLAANVEDGSLQLHLLGEHCGGQQPPQVQPVPLTLTEGKAWGGCGVWGVGCGVWGVGCGGGVECVVWVSRGPGVCMMEGQQQQNARELLSVPWAPAG
jgi:hypothetical protein